MAQKPTQPTSIDTVFRVHKFVVPVAVCDAFINKMQHIQKNMLTLPGCLRAYLLKQTSGPGEFNVLMFAEWLNSHAVAAASATMQQRFAEENFDPKAFLQQLGIRDDLGFYSLVRSEV